MKKKMSLILGLVLVAALTVGCGPKNAANNAGAGANDQPKTEDTAESVEKTEPTGAIKTGLGVVTNTANSKDAAADAEGVAEIYSTVAAVTVDESGVIIDCIIDAVQSKIGFSTEGKLTTAMDTMFPSKNELGEAYGMKAASAIGKEWNEQAQAFADYCVGKTAEEVAGIAVKEGLAADADLAASITVHVTDFMAVVQKAVNNAAALGAQAGDKLGFTASTNMSKSTDATADAAAVAQAYSTYSVVTVNASGVITSAIIDATQGTVNFDTTGKITSDLAAESPTKNELGEAYGMKAASAIGKEWNEQAAAFATYCTGKTAEEVNGIAVTAGLAADADLLAAVTVHVTDFMSVISNAVANAK